MIDVLKRLAELDADNPNIIKESQQVEECGMMPGMVPEMGMDIAPEKPAMPASINMTAGSGEELSNMLATIMQLAGVKGAEEPMGGEPAPQTLEPVGAGPETPADSMRSVIDKLNPMGGDDVDGLDRDHDGDHDMDDHDMEKDKEETDEGGYDNSPADPNKKNEFDANQFANKENQPGQGDRMDGTSPKAYADMNEAVTDLFAQYKRFVSEN